VSTTETTEAVRKTIVVDASPETAFRVFTDQIETWWPLATHGVFGDDAERLAFIDGELVETAKDGRKAVWGRVLDWEPSRRLRMTWRPGFDADMADTELELRFAPEGDGTRVELEHGGWERLENGATSRSNYDGGWVGVLEKFRTAF
jgi:uncharacterized protein YndB with AHSA1/START domain